MNELISQPDYWPTRKVAAAGLVGTPAAVVLAAVLTWALGVPVDASLTAAALSTLGGLAATIAGYFARERAPGLR